MLVMSINVDSEWPFSGWNGGLPQGVCTAGERIGERFDLTSRGYLGKEPLHMSVPIRSRAACKQGQSIAGLAQSRPTCGAIPPQRETTGLRAMTADSPDVDG
jgi:hypothetical protein